MQIKILTLENWPEIESKLNSIKNFRIGQTKQEIHKELYFEYTKNSLISETESVFGFYTDDLLVSMTTVHEFNFMPSYLVKNFRSFTDTNLYNPLQNGLAPTLNHIIELYEKKNLYTFYMVKTADPKRLNQKRVRKLMFEIGCPKLQNYDITVEEFIQAGTKSIYRVHSDAICLGVVFEYDVVILRYTCNQNFRTNISENLKEKIITKY